MAERKRARKTKQGKTRQAQRSGTAGSPARNALRDAETQNDLGVGLKRLGRYAEAISCFLKALELAPGYGNAHNNLGTTFLAMGMADAAAGSFRQAIALTPSDAVSHFNLGLALKIQNRVAEAAASFREAISLNPGLAPAHNMLGLCLRDLHQREAAVECFRKALAIDPSWAKAMNNLSLCLRDLQKPEEAMAYCLKALALDPDSPEFLNNHGTLLQEMGRLEEAEAVYRKIISSHPDEASAHYHLSGVRKVTEDDRGDVKAMQALYERPDIDEDNRTILAFGLGKAFDDLKEYGRAFDFYFAGNALKRKQVAFDIAEETARYDALKTLFSADFFARFPEAGVADRTPIFVLGMPRSGTSLVEQILASHPEVQGAGELFHLSDAVTDRFGRFESPAFFEALAQAVPGDFRQTGERYVSQLRRHSAEARFITDKMPLNFRYIGLIRLALPNAKVIHCRRDPMATCLSLFKTLFHGNGNNFAYGLAEIGGFHKLYQDWMAHCHAVLPGFVHDVRYEDLVTGPEPQVRALLDHCGLEWNGACLRPHETKRQVRTASSAQVRAPIHTGSLALWEKYGDRLAPLKQALG